MSQLIDSSNDDHNSYFDSIRYLLDPSLTGDELSNSVIDSLAYLVAIEDELIELIPTVLDEDYEHTETARKYLVYSTALELLYKYDQIIQESDIQESTRYAERDRESEIARLKARLNKVSKILGISTDAVTESILQMRAVSTTSRL